MKRLIATLLTLLFCVNLLVGCNKQDADTESTAEETPKLEIVSGELSNYKLIYSTAMNENGPSRFQARKMSELIPSTIKAATGVTLEMEEDTAAPTENEIVVGRTNRMGSYTAPAADSFGTGFALFVSGQKIVLEGGSNVGLYLGTCELIEVLLGVNLLENEAATPMEAPVSVTIPQNYEKVRTLFSDLFPYLDVKLSDFVIAYEVQDYVQRRAAIILQQEILAQDSVKLSFRSSADITADSVAFMIKKDETVENGDYRIETAGNTVMLLAGDYYGMQAAIRSLMSIRESAGCYPFEDTQKRVGSYVESLSNYEQSATYAFSKTADHRIMFYNILMDSTSMAERATLQSQMIKEYAPDVVGLQEFHAQRRPTLVPMLNQLGYEETIDPAVENAKTRDQGGCGLPKNVEIKQKDGGYYYTAYNYVPIFYNTNTTICVDSDFYWYKNQEDSKNAPLSANDAASKALTWAVLESKETGDRYIIVNVHMCVGSETIKKLQAIETMAVIDGLLKEHNAPVFLGGDYNGHYESPNYLHFVENGEMTDIEKNNLATEFTSKVKTYHRPYPVLNETLNLMWPGENDKIEILPSGSVDHILIKNADDVEVRVYGVIVDDYTISGGDHFPIFADVSF